MRESDYIFRYQINPEIRGSRSPRDRCMGMIQDQLKNLLNLIVPCSGDDEVDIDGFKLLNNPNEIHPVFQEDANGHRVEEALQTRTACESQNNTISKTKPGVSYQNIRNAALYEPRIEFIKNQLESILSLVDLETGGKTARVDGFRLKDLKDWVVPISSDPSEIFEHAGTRCNCDCLFCYNKGTPPGLALQSPKRSPKEEFRELTTRIKYYNPVADQGLFPTIGSPHEVLSHPYIKDVLRALRRKTEKNLRIVTNGASLNPEMIDVLAELKPVYLDIDLNSSDPLRRKRLMRDYNPHIAIDSLALLKQAEIPFAVIVVPWPEPSAYEMLDDLEKTVMFACSHDVHIVQISLPGYSQYLSEKKLFDHDTTWRMIVAKVGELRGKYDVPVVIMPGMFEENITREKKNVAEITGLVKHSPAAIGGLKRGDIITRIGGIQIKNRPQARDILSIMQQNRTGVATIEVNRAGNKSEHIVDLSQYAYPSFPSTDTHAGIVFMGTGLRTRYIEQLKTLIRVHGATHVLFLSSALMKPGFEQELSGRYGFGDIDFHIEVPENQFFGGNIFMGDLLVVTDFIRCIDHYIKTKRCKPDLVVIPSSPFHLSQWGRDLTGRCYLDIQRKTGVPVALLPCETIYD